jgi:hypothetical protein
MADTRTGAWVSNNQLCRGIVFVSGDHHMRGESLQAVTSTFVHRLRNPIGPAGGRDGAGYVGVLVQAVGKA